MPNEGHKQKQTNVATKEGRRLRQEDLQLLGDGRETGVVIPEGSKARNTGGPVFDPSVLKEGHYGEV